MAQGCHRHHPKLRAPARLRALTGTATRGRRTCATSVAGRPAVHHHQRLRRPLPAPQRVRPARDLFWALNGATGIPCRASQRHSPAAITLLPASELVPATSSAPLHQTARLRGWVPAPGPAGMRRATPDPAWPLAGGLMAGPALNTISGDRGERHGIWSRETTIGNREGRRALCTVCDPASPAARAPHPVGQQTAGTRLPLTRAMCETKPATANPGAGLVPGARPQSSGTMASRGSAQ